MPRDVDERKKRKALRKIRKAAMLAEQGLGPPLSDWERQFLEEVEERIEKFGSAFHDLEKGSADEALSSLQRNLSATGRDQVRGEVQALLDDPPELDMRRWMQGVELTADRVGFLLAGDLGYATAVIRASVEEQVTERTRLEQLTVYAVSREYLALRETLGLRIG